jgi:CBS domain containing-hemolysin-like protein
MQEKVREEARQVARGTLALAGLLGPSVAHASFLSGDTLDAAANVLSWVILVLVPVVAIGAFFYVHVLPELIAERRQHPHKDSIKVLCILSLFFGGLLWPFAWLWAYTKPIGYRAIYGTERHEDYYLEMGEKARAGALSPAEVDHLREELAMMASKVTLSPELKRLVAELDAIAAARKAAAPVPAHGGAE